MRNFLRILSWCWCFSTGWLLGYLAAVRPEDASVASILAMAFWCIALGIAWSSESREPQETRE